MPLRADPALRSSPQQTALLTTPSDCPGAPLTFGAQARSWEQPDITREATYRSADLAGNPVSLSGCNQLEFKPTISSQPTTDLTESPSGLDFDLHQPQEAPHPEPLDGRAGAILKGATVTLPAGFTVNPSQADGLGACSRPQVGFLAEEAGVPLRQVPAEPAPTPPSSARSKSPRRCSPSTRRRRHQARDDPETHRPLPEPLHGSVYLAKPLENPFGSLLALYIDDRRPRHRHRSSSSPGGSHPDPQTGQLTTTFEENPQLPFEDFRLHFFGGARGPLITPPTCGYHTTDTDLTPWSTPEGADAHPADTFQTTSGSPAAAPARSRRAPTPPPSRAGTVSPQAGAYSPFVLKLSREDGSQRSTARHHPAPGPDRQAGRGGGVLRGPDRRGPLAQPPERRHPKSGRTPPAPPPPKSAPSTSAPAPARPLLRQGHAYLAGPYKGAPLEHGDHHPGGRRPLRPRHRRRPRRPLRRPRNRPDHAVKSDPIPTILHGIPLDVRSIAVKLDRPEFTLNPTNCDPMAITGSATSVLNQSASLTAPSRSAAARPSAFKPKLALTPEGRHQARRPPGPARALTYPSPATPTSPGPRSPCPTRSSSTRPTSAPSAPGCSSPPGGQRRRVPARPRSTATPRRHPAARQPLEGPVYLRSSAHKLPDLVAALNGQIDVALDGKIDSGQGGIRNTFEVVPDAPVSKFVLEHAGRQEGPAGKLHQPLPQAQPGGRQMDGQNGKVDDFNPVVGNSCKQGKKHRVHKGKRSSR